MPEVEEFDEHFVHYQRDHCITHNLRPRNFFPIQQLIVMDETEIVRVGRGGIGNTYTKEHIANMKKDTDIEVGDQCRICDSRRRIRVVFTEVHSTHKNYSKI